MQLFKKKGFRTESSGREEVCVILNDPLQLSATFLLASIFSEYER